VRQQQVSRRRARRGDADGAVEELPPASTARAADATAQVLSQIDAVLGTS
jgi:hypothetical protein